jgi:hypothetical protein
MMIDLREPEVFIGKMAQHLHPLVRAHALVLDIFQQFPQPMRLHSVQDPAR